MSLTRRLLIALLAAAAITALVGELAQRSSQKPCLPPPSPARAGPAGSAPAVAALLEDVPCPGTGRAVYNLRDDRGVPMAVLDPIADPAGGYLGVYHARAERGARYEILLAHSRDLIHWHQLEVLDPVGASMPTLRSVPDGRGFLLAYEKAVSVGVHMIRIAYYRSQADLLRGHPVAARDLPLRYSAWVNGTPSFTSIHWPGAITRSIIRLGFHYLRADPGGRPQDREASGTLQGFRRWSSRRDVRIDHVIDGARMEADHGDERQFTLGPTGWRVYEATPAASGFAAWHVLLYSLSTGRLYPLAFHTAAGVFAASFGNPIVAVLPAPGGGGRVLAMTVFVFSSGPARQESGELLFYRPLG